MNFTYGKTQISISFLLAAGLGAAALLPGKLLPLLLGAILLHEGGHFLYIVIIGGRATRICFSSTGIRVTLSEYHMSQNQELWLNLWGPAVNLLLGVVLLASGEGTMQMMRWTAVNFAVAAVTLLPLGQSDGTAIVDILLEWCCGKRTERFRLWLRRGIGIAMAAGLFAVCRAFG